MSHCAQYETAWESSRETDQARAQGGVPAKQPAGVIAFASLFQWLQDHGRVPVGLHRSKSQEGRVVLIRSVLEGWKICCGNLTPGQRGLGVALQRTPPWVGPAWWLLLAYCYQLLVNYCQLLVARLLPVLIWGLDRHRSCCGEPGNSGEKPIAQLWPASRRRERRATVMTGPGASWSTSILHIVVFVPKYSRRSSIALLLCSPAVPPHPPHLNLFVQRTRFICVTAALPPILQASPSISTSQSIDEGPTTTRKRQSERKMSDISINPAVQERLQILRAQQAESQARQQAIEAEIATLIPSATSFQQHQSTNHKQFQHHPRDVPRRMPPTGATMARHLSSGRIEKSSSQRSAHSMTRTNSKGSSSARPGNPHFSSQMSPPLPDFRQGTNGEGPWTPFTYALPHSPSQRKPEVERVLDVGEHPAAYLHRTTPSLSLALPTIPSTPMTSRNRQFFGTSPTHTMPTPTTPTSVTLTNATTLTSNMSRQSSLCNEPLLHSIEMLNVNSNTSFLSTNLHGYDHTTSDQSIAPYVSSLQTHRSLNEDQSLLLKGTGGASHDSQFSYLTAEDMAHCHSSSFSGEKMEKSTSNESTSSSSSSSSRSKERLKAQIQTAASRRLAPKYDGEEHALSLSKSSESLSQFRSRDASQEVVVTTKPSYQRPKHDKVFCKECDDHPDGFRGEHELRRHQDRQHKKMVKKWVCIQPSGPEHPKPAQPLIKCKACTQQKKRYNAYYNAAAHLRRAHFRPKAKTRGKSSKVDEANKRGGKAGGDWPKMSELKHWMREVEERATDFSLTASQQEEADASEDEDCDIEELSPGTMSGITGGNFDTSLLVPDLTFNAFSPSTNSELCGMASMQFFDLTQLSQQSIDSSLAGSQSSFEPLSFSQNDQQAFTDSSSFLSHHYPDDPLLYPDVQFPYQ